MFSIEPRPLFVIRISSNAAHVAINSDLASKGSTVFDFVRSTSLFVSASVLICICGCGGDGPVGGPENLIPVTGKVTLDGSPVSGASINFTPRSAGGSSFATTTEDGSYELLYGASAVGAIEGDHIVTIEVGEFAEPSLPEDLDTSKMSEEQVTAKLDEIAASMVTELPAKYSNGDEELTAKVVKDGGPIDFALTSD